MDILKIETNFLKGLLGKVITKQIKRKAGIDCKVEIKSIEVTFGQGETMNGRLDIGIEMKKEDIGNVVRGCGLL